MSTISTVKGGKNGASKRDRKKLAVRIIVWVLIASMLGGSFFYFIYFLVYGRMIRERVAGGEYSPSYLDKEAAEDDYLIRIAIEYGSGVSYSMRTSSASGYIVGTETRDSVFTESFRTSSTVLHAAYRTSLVKNASDNYVPAGDDEPEIGPYHVCIFTGGDTFLLDYIPVIRSAFHDGPVFRASVDGEDCIMLGSFADSDGAEDFRAVLIQEFAPEPKETESETETESESESCVQDESGAQTTGDTSETETIPDVTSEEMTSDSDTSFVSETVSTAEEPDPFSIAVLDAVISSPDDNSLYLINGEGEIEYMSVISDSDLSLALRGIPDPDGNTFIWAYRSAGSRKYDGTLEFKAIRGDDYFGVRIVDVLPLDTYAAGVIPYEISSSWPLETQKAFCIAVKSYALTRRGAHASSGADLCCTTHCQVYKGFASTNDRVWQAVNAVKGLIGVASNGRICCCYYSSSTGGCTANVNEVWSGSLTTYPYLKAVATPWEKYNSHNKAHWTKEYTPDELYQRLKSKGYTGLKAPVKSVVITTGNNTSYVKSVLITDTKGNSVTISKSTVSSALGLNSGNFVVGKNGETVSRRNLVMAGFNATNNEPTIGVDILSHPFEYSVTGRQVFSVLTSDGVRSFADGNEEKVATARGVLDFPMSKSLDSSYYPTVTGVGGQILPDVLNIESSLEQEELTLSGNVAGSFVFVGRGWGHGLGMSQFGAYDMGVLGYDYETIFKAYYSGARLVDISEVLK